MAGNSVLLKHASNVQGCAGLIAKIFAAAGFPPGTFINLVIGSDKVGQVIENEAVKGVSLTGSEAAGQKVAEAAGRNIKKAVLELGGSNAFVVLEDADLEAAAETGVRARMMNAGQSCISAKRFIIDRKVSERFIAMFIERVNRLRLGDPADPDTDMGPLASAGQAEIVDRQVARSLEMGARLLTGGTRDKAFYPPSVITDVNPGMPVFEEEVFGPVAPLITAGNETEAIYLANKTRFGLGVSLFTRDIEKALRLAGEFQGWGSIHKRTCEI